MDKRKKIILSITLSISFVILSICIVFLIVWIFIYGIIDQENRYYKKANWNVTRDLFYEDYYPNIKNYFESSLPDLVDKNYEVDGDKYRYIINYESNYYKVNMNIEVFDDLCVFNIEFYYYYNDVDYSYNDIEFYDEILTEFAKKAFYDYEIHESIILDIFDENIEGNGYYYYDDSAVGTLGSGYSFSKGDFYSIKSENVMSISTKSILRDSDKFIERLREQ